MSAQTQTHSSVWQRTTSFTLLLPVQATLYVSLCSLILWTVYFSTYPPAHNSMHSLRHHTLMVSCH